MSLPLNGKIVWMRVRRAACVTPVHLHSCRDFIFTQQMLFAKERHASARRSTPPDRTLSDMCSGSGSTLPSSGRTQRKTPELLARGAQKPASASVRWSDLLNEGKPDPETDPSATDALHAVQELLCARVCARVDVKTSMTSSKLFSRKTPTNMTTLTFRTN